MNPSTTALRFRSTVDAEEMLHGLLLTHATVTGIEETGGDIIFFIPTPEWIPAVRDAVTHAIASEAGIRFIGAEEIEDRDWNAEWEATVEPQWATKELLITPSWHMDRARAMSPRYLITIDPKMSFGTGHHETTRLCLAAVEGVGVAGKTVLDIGTGSGVLAIYALQRGATRAVGLDTDPWSIDNAQENRALNGIADSTLDIRAGTLAETVAPTETFDLIFANIHRNVLIEIAGEILARCNASATVILSGLLIYDADDVRAVFERAGFTFLRQLTENEWACIVLAR